MVNKPYKAIPCLNKQMNIWEDFQRRMQRRERDKSIETNAFQKKFALMQLFDGGSAIWKGGNE